MVHPVYADLPTTIFEVMSGLARDSGAINLGQGFPDEPGPRAGARARGHGGHRGLQPVSADARPAPAA